MAPSLIYIFPVEKIRLLGWGQTLLPITLDNICAPLVECVGLEYLFRFDDKTLLS